MASTCSTDHVSLLVGGVPGGAQTRQFWANNSHVQAQAWREAGWHIERVHLDDRWVEFEPGRRGGTYEANGRRAGGPRI